MMTQDEWQSLVGSAGWPKFKQYLTDCREGLKEAIARGAFSGDKLPGALAECRLLRQHVEITFEQIDDYYRVEPKQQEETE